MFSAFKKLVFLTDKKLKKKLVLIYFITIIGTFLETAGIGIILPILKINIYTNTQQQKNLQNNHSSHNNNILFPSLINIIFPKKKL